MNIYDNSDIMPESSPTIEEPAYKAIGYAIHEIFWTGWGDENVIREFELLGQFQDRAAAWDCYNKHKTGIRDVRMIEIQQYPDGHIEYARIGGVA